MTEARDGLIDTALRDNPVAVYARLSECLLDFYIYTEFLLISRTLCKSTNFAALEGRLHALVFISGNRSARFLNSKKYRLESWFTSLQSEINSAWLRQDPVLADQISLAFDSMNRAFQRLTALPLLLSNSIECETIVENT